MGGRIADLAVDEGDPNHFYIGTASGGVFRTTNDGMSWQPLFDEQPVASIGDVTLAPSNPNIVWVGTGEPQNRQSSPYGAGVFRSMDAGRSWTFMGLEDTRHIARILVHPRNPDVVYVAAVGHLWGPNEQRGVYRTDDGGSTWQRVLYIDEHTGAIDLAMDPGDPRTLFAAMYQRQRTAWGFSASGTGSGLYRTTDGGDSWDELSHGLPDGDKGRIGIDVYRRDGNLLYALVEARAGQGRGLYRSRDRGESWELMSTTNPRPMYFSQVRIDPNNPERLYVLGVQLHVSDDGGRTFWEDDGAEGIHVDHHAMWINPADSEHIMLGSDGGVSSSRDGSRTWRMFDNIALGQFYQIGVDMREPYYVCGGLQDNSSWCGPSNTLNDYGIRNGDWYDVAGGDGFYTVIDPANPMIMFAESQGGNVSRVDVTTGEGARIRPEARPDSTGEDREYRWNWNTPIVISAHDPATVYVGSNVLLRSRDRGHQWDDVSGDLTKQLDRSELEIMGVLPTDETLSLHDGVGSYGNITTIAESPLDAAVLYVGTDDGNLQLTRDGGATWTNVAEAIPELPERTYVSHVTASLAAPGRVYATFDGHYADDYAPYVYVSENYGERWRRIVNGLPDWSVNVIEEHPSTPDLLFVGNEAGVYVTFDRGGRWTRLDGELPTVPVDDIIVHPRDNDLVVGTHGRSIWILEDLTMLQELSDDVLASTAHLFTPRTTTMYSRAGGWPFWGDNYQAPNPPHGVRVRYYVGNPEPALAEDNGANSDDNGDANGDGHVTIEILERNGEVVRTLEGPSAMGIHEVVWDFRMQADDANEEGGGGRFGGGRRAPRVLPGEYHARLRFREAEMSRPMVLEGDPRISISRADLEARQELLVSLHALGGPVRESNGAIRNLTDQVAEIERVVADREGVADEIGNTTDSLEARLEELRDEFRDVGRALRLSGAIEASTSRPTADQEWQVNRVWEDVTAAVTRLNALIENDVPAWHRLLNTHGIRPDPGNPVELPRRPSH
jgi:photosystem II stability/assembly factor-like uncharacterized protein